VEEGDSVTEIGAEEHAPMNAIIIATKSEKKNARVRIMDPPFKSL
jgi:hypothetical protein